MALAEKSIAYKSHVQTNKKSNDKRCLWRMDSLLKELPGTEQALMQWQGTFVAELCLAK